MKLLVLCSLSRGLFLYGILITNLESRTLKFEMRWIEEEVDIEGVAAKTKVLK